MIADPNLLGTEVMEEYTHSELSTLAQTPIQFDVWLPSYNLAFEYQGQHHYRDVMIFGLQKLYKGIQ